MNSCIEPEGFMLHVHDTFERYREHYGEAPLYHVSTKGLYLAYLNSFDPEYRQKHNCHRCAEFIGVFGGLVRIGVDGQISSLLWDERTEVPDGYGPALQVLRTAVESRPVLGRFYTDRPGAFWGYVQEGGFHHLHVRSVASAYCSDVKVQRAKNKKDLVTLRSFLKRTSLKTFVRIVSLVEEYPEHYSVSRCLVQWLMKLKLRVVNHHRVDALLWKVMSEDEPMAEYAVSLVRNSYLDGLANLSHHRAVIHVLGEDAALALALERRPSRLAEVIDQALWKPGHPVSDNRWPDGRVNRTSWKHFLHDILPQAVTMQVVIKSTMNWGAFTSPVHPQAPVLFHWGHPYACYFHHQNDESVRYGFQPGEEVEIECILPLPVEWGVVEPRGVLFVPKNVAVPCERMALFPQWLKEEYRPLSDQLTAHGSTGYLPHVATEGVAGIGFSGKGPTPTLLVTDRDHQTTSWVIDRLE